MNEIIENISSILIETVPEKNWEKIEIRVEIISSQSQITAKYYKNKTNKTFDPNNNKKGQDYDIGELFIELREKMYKTAVNKGAWYSVLFTIYDTGKFNTNYEYNKKPSFTYEPKEKEYIEDLEIYPRKLELIPNWLKEILQKYEKSLF